MCPKLTLFCLVNSLSLNLPTELVGFSTFIFRPPELMELNILLMFTNCWTRCRMTKCDVVWKIFPRKLFLIQTKTDNMSFVIHLFCNNTVRNLNIGFGFVIFSDNSFFQLAERHFFSLFFLMTYNFTTRLVFKQEKVIAVILIIASCFSE